MTNNRGRSITYLFLGVGADFKFSSGGVVYDSVTTTLKSPSQTDAQRYCTYVINTYGNNFEIGFLWIMNGTITRNVLITSGSPNITDNTFSLSTAYNGNIIVQNPTNTDWWEFQMSNGIALK